MLEDAQHHENNRNQVGTINLWSTSVVIKLMILETGAEKSFTTLSCLYSSYALISVPILSFFYSPI